LRGRGVPAAVCDRRARVLGVTGNGGAVSFFVTGKKKEIFYTGGF
jgi:hypothetical protein